MVAHPVFFLVLNRFEACVVQHVAETLRRVHQSDSTNFPFRPMLEEFGLGDQAGIGIVLPLFEVFHEFGFLLIKVRVYAGGFENKATMNRAQKVTNGADGVYHALRCFTMDTPRGVHKIKLLVFVPIYNEILWKVALDVAEGRLIALRERIEIASRINKSDLNSDVVQELVCEYVAVTNPNFQYLDHWLAVLEVRTHGAEELGQARRFDVDGVATSIRVLLPNWKEHVLFFFLVITITIIINILFYNFFIFLL